VFVVIALATGFSSARETVLSACSVLLAVSAITSAIVMLPRVEESAAAAGATTLPGGHHT